MKIDWFTLIAQVINFLVLMWLLKRYLYKPILKAIDERENKIKAQLKDADITKKQAEKEQATFRQKIEDFDRKKEEMMEKAMADIKEKKQRLDAQVRQEASDLKAKLEKDLDEEKELKGREVSKRITGEALAIVRKILSDISSTTLEAETVKTFVQKIGSLPADEKKQLLTAFGRNSEGIRVHSAFKLSPAQKERIEKAVSGVLGAKKASFEFSTVPELISGIELTASGYKISWNLSEYLRELEKHYQEAQGSGPG